MIIVLSMCSWANAAEMDIKYVNKALEVMNGSWYDNNDNLVLRISNHTINGCPVVAGYNFAGGTSNAKGVFRIYESAGYRDLIIEWHISHTYKDYLILNNVVYLHK